MNNGSELTNVPDYQKIKQTGQVISSKSAPIVKEGWSEEVETLTPSPIVHPPVGSNGPLRYSSSYTWANQSPSHKWSTQYNASKYSSMTNIMTNMKDPAYPLQSFNRPVKYIDTDEVHRRFQYDDTGQRVNRTMTPNRRSYTEGLLSDFKDVMHSSGLKSSQSQKNLDYSSPLNRDLVNMSNYDSQPSEHQWKKIGGGHVTSTTSHEDLRNWQQHHQEELLHQHLETQALYEAPGNTSHLSNEVGNLSITEESPAKWEPVRRAADNIIREKNMIIDKLKNRILELEEDYRVSESKLRQVLANQEQDADLMQHKLQELRYKNTSLKDKLKQELNKQSSDMDELEIKLGGKEHEVLQLKEVIRDKDMDCTNLREKCAEKDREALAWKDKFEESRLTMKDMKKKLDSLQRYLDDLPTADESRLQSHQLLQLREENASLKSRFESSEKKLNQARKLITSRDFQIREMDEREKDLEGKLSDLSGEVSRLQDTDGSQIYHAQVELSNLKADKQRLAIDLEKAKKLLETTHGKIRQMEVKHQSDLRSAAERISQEEETVTSLRTEVCDREAQIEKLKISIKELGCQNQELLEQSLLVREQIKSMEGQNAVSDPASHKLFMSQLTACYSELNTLVHVCLSQANGDEPDISALLTVRGRSEDENRAVGGKQDTESVAQWLEKLGQLRRSVDTLRAHVCNKYAQDMGDNITCATQ